MVYEPKHDVLVNETGEVMVARSCPLGMLPDLLEIADGRLWSHEVGRRYDAGMLTPAAEAALSASAEVPVVLMDAEGRIADAGIVPILAERRAG